MNAGNYETVINDSACVINGELNQKRKCGDWNQRFCAVWKNYFLCYKDKIDLKPQVAFTLEGFQVEKCNISDNEKFTFELSKPGVVTHVFQTDSEDNLKEWILKIQDLINSSVEAHIPEKTDADSVAMPDEVTSISYTFPAVDIENDKLINLQQTSELHTSLSFDSATDVTRNESPSEGVKLQRSDEIEDLSHVEYSDEELVTVEKNNVECSRPEIETEFFDDEVEVFEEKSEFEINDSIRREVEEEFVFQVKDRSKSLSEEVFEALGMVDEIEIMTEIEEEIIPGQDQTNTSEEFIFVQEKGKQTSKSKDTMEQNITENVSVQRLKETFQKECKGNLQMHGRELKLEKSPRPQIKGFVNVTLNSSSEWTKMWAELKDDQIELKQSPNSEESKQIIPVKGLQLQPSAWDTSRLLAFKLIRDNEVEVIIEPNDVQDFGRWVSGIFHCVQHPRNQQDVAKKFTSSLNPSEANTSDCEAEMKGEDGIDVVSVKEMRAIFENANVFNSPPASIYSSPSPVFDFRSQLTSTPSDQSPSRILSPQDFEANYEKMKAKLPSNYADVVCSLGRYIEQEEEKQILSSMANPFLAKLRLRHKLEMIAQIEEATIGLKENIHILREKLSQKEDAKREVSGRKNSTGLIKSAEDAKRAGNESKRMDKEVENIQSQIQQAESQLGEMKNAAYQLQREIETAYEQFDWGQENGHKNETTSEEVVKREKEFVQPRSKLMKPSRTKDTKEKAKVCQHAGSK